MKKTVMLGFAVAIVSFNAIASDVKYPAANFQPQVIYQDKSVTTAAASTEVDAKYPAANFQPTVIYSAPDVGKTAAKPVADEFDPKYPAANFQPKVIYP